MFSDNVCILTRLIAKILKLQVFSSDCFPNQWSDIITSPLPYITLMAKNRKKVMGTGTSDPTPLLEEVGTPTSGNPPVSSESIKDNLLCSV